MFSGSLSKTESRNLLRELLCIGMVSCKGIPRGTMACRPLANVQSLQEATSLTPFGRGCMGLVGITLTIARSMLMGSLGQ